MQALFPTSSIVKVLSSTKLDIHVAHRSASFIFEEPGVTCHDLDPSAETLKPLLTDIKPDLVISTVHGGNFETQKEIIDCAVETGVPRFIPSEFGQDSLNEKVQERLPPSRERARTIEYLRTLSGDGRISWVALATGVVLDRGLLRGNLGFDIKWQSATLNGQGHERFAASSAAWIGMVVNAVMQHWRDVQNQYLYVAGLITTGNEVISALQEASGKTFAVGRQDPADSIKEADKRIEQGYPDAGMFLYERSVMYDETLAAVKPFEDADAKTKLGVDGEALTALIKSVMHEHEHHGGKADCGCG